MKLRQTITLQLDMPDAGPAQVHAAMNRWIRDLTDNLPTDGEIRLFSPATDFVDAVREALREHDEASDA